MTITVDGVPLIAYVLASLRLVAWLVAGLLIYAFYGRHHSHLGKELRGEIARHGVWSYHHGDNRFYRGGPPGFWEVMEDQPVIEYYLRTGSTLPMRVSDTVPLEEWRRSVLYREHLEPNGLRWTLIHFIPTADRCINSVSAFLDGEDDFTERDVAVLDALYSPKREMRLPDGNKQVPVFNMTFSVR